MDVSSGRSARDRKSTRLNSSHRCISYAVFCLKNIGQGIFQSGTDEQRVVIAEEGGSSNHCRCVFFPTVSSGKYVNVSIDYRTSFFKIIRLPPIRTHFPSPNLLQA